MHDVINHIGILSEPRDRRQEGPRAPDSPEPECTIQTLILYCLQVRYQYCTYAIVRTCRGHHKVILGIGDSKCLENSRQKR